MELLENDALSPKTTGKRRVSGRAVRAPEKFVPNAPSSQPTGKRKRGAGANDEDVENEVEQEEEESDEVDEDDSPVEEEIREKKKRTKTPKKPVVKRPKVNGAAPPASAPAVRLPTRQKKPKKVVIQDPNAEGLYAEIFMGRDSSDAVAAAWLRRYDEDNTASMTDLVNCILKSAGCELKVTEDDVNDPDNIPSKLNDMQDEYKGQNMPDYPSISKAKSGHAFKVSLVDFFESLVAAMHTLGVLYDDIALIENIQLWVTTMSSSFLRPFRHTATVVALAITTSLCNVAKEQTKAAADSLTMLEGEKKKRGSNKNRIAAFQKQVEQGNERRELCENTIRDFFDTVFVHRYRDVDPKIRTDCVEALGQWVMTLPGIFMEGAYLRYLGWMLSDPSAPTRHEAIKQLEKIMKNSGDNIGGIREFIERFRPRILMIATRDSEIGVRASAIDLLDLFRDAGMIEPDDIDVIGKLIFDSEPRVRKAVVGFFAENIKDLYESKIEELGGDEALEDAFAEGEDDFEKPRPEWIKLKCLAEVLLSYSLAEDEDSQSETDPGMDGEALKTSGGASRFTHAAQALYDRIPEIRNWKRLAGYLLFDHSLEVDPNSSSPDVQVGLRNAFKLEEKEEVILLEILDAAVKLNLSQPEDHDKAKDKSKKKTSAETKEMQESIARHLAVIVPRLLSKFGASPKTTAAVLRLEQLLNLGIFQALRMESTAYAELLHEIGVQFKGHSDQRVLNEASAAFLHARTFEELEDVTEENMQALWDDTIEDMRKRFHASSKAAGTTARGDLNIEHLIDFTSTVARVSKLTNIMNPVPWFEAKPKGKKSSGRAAMVPIDILIEIINRGILTEADPEIDELEDSVVTSAARSTFFYFMWKARDIQSSIASSTEISDVDIDAIKERLETFKAGLFSVLDSRGGIDDLRLYASGALLDAHVLFSTLDPAKLPMSKDAAGGEDSSNQYTYLSILVQEIEPPVQEELTSIFVSAEKTYAKKARKALEPPAEDDEPEDIDDESSDDDDDAQDPNSEARVAETLKSEQQLCELTGKLVCAILAEVIDHSGPLMGQLKARVARNRMKLGHNFKEVVAYLDDKPKAKGKSHKSKAQQSAEAAKAAAAAKHKSRETVDDNDDEDDEDPFAAAEGEKELEEELASEDGDESGKGKEGPDEGDDDDIMGD